MLGIPYTLLQGQEANDVPTFWLLRRTDSGLKGVSIWVLSGAKYLKDEMNPKRV